MKRSLWVLLGIMAIGIVAAMLPLLAQDDSVPPEVTALFDDIADIDHRNGHRTESVLGRAVNQRDFIIVFASATCIDDAGAPAAAGCASGEVGAVAGAAGAVPGRTPVSASPGPGEGRSGGLPP